MERAGTRNTVVTVQLRSAGTGSGGAPVDVWTKLDDFWVSVEVRPPESVTRNGMVFDQEMARFRFDWLDGQGFGRSARIVHAGKPYEIKSIDGQSDTRKTVIVDAGVALSDSAARQESIERRIREGIIVTVRREDFGVEPVDVPARALVEGYQPDEIVGGINQGDRRIFILAADVPNGIKNGDLIILPGGEYLTAQNVDAYSHRVGDNLIAYEMTGTGA